MGKNSYNKGWETSCPWLKAVFGDPHSAHCSYCKSNLSIAAKGITGILDHEKTDKHKRNSAPYDVVQR